MGNHNISSYYFGDVSKTIQFFVMSLLFKTLFFKLWTIFRASAGLIHALNNVKVIKKQIRLNLRMLATKCQVFIWTEPGRDDCSRMICLQVLIQRLHRVCATPEVRTNVGCLGSCIKYIQMLSELPWRKGLLGSQNYWYGSKFWCESKYFTWTKIYFTWVKTNLDKFPNTS